MKGLRFRKLDLHVHSPASKDFNRPMGMQDDAIADAIVQAAIDKGLDGIAITDHNSADWIDTMRKAGRGKPLVIFPGVEITATGGKSGIHVIALFDPSKRWQACYGSAEQARTRTRRPRKGDNGG